MIEKQTNKASIFICGLLAGGIAYMAVTSHYNRPYMDSCQITLNAMDAAIEKARVFEGIDKIHYGQIAQMNLDILLSKGCCQNKDTCPAAVYE